MAGVELRGVDMTYPDGAHAVRELDLHVEDGELMVLLGPSGCGKTTILRLIAGLESPTAGEILIDGHSVNGLGPRERNVAMVFQSYALYPHMTVHGNLEFPLRMGGSGGSQREARVREISALLELDALMDKKPARLSGGQQQRVAMGRALVRDPSVFLLDEPLSNLDASLRGRLRTEIAALQARVGVTTVYVTHDQVEAMTLGRRVAVLRNGRLRQVGAGRDLYEHPADTFVASFLGQPGMNLVRARVDRREDGIVARVGASTVPLPAEVRGRAPRLESYAGGGVILGIRPEALRLERRTPEEGSLSGSVDAVEMLGAEHVLHVALPVRPDGAGPNTRGSGGADQDGDRIAARLPSTGAVPSVGEGVELFFDPIRARFFDPDGASLHGRA